MPVGPLLRGMMFFLPAAVAARAQEAAAPGAGLEGPLIAPGEGDRLTLWMMIENGGVILGVIGGLSVIAVLMMLYFFLTITPRREIPRRFSKEARKQIRAGELENLARQCRKRRDLLSKVLQAGLKVAGHDRFVIQEAMESEGERGATLLWQRISYLNNIGVIAPLLGLLGTVWGMMQAFGAIALDDTQVRGLAMAYSVAQAMTTTAAGLALAIPAMAVYFYLRGRVTRIVSEVEAHASEFIDLLSEEGRS